MSGMTNVPLRASIASAPGVVGRSRLCDDARAHARRVLRRDLILERGRHEDVDGQLEQLRRAAHRRSAFEARQAAAPHDVRDRIIDVDAARSAKAALGVADRDDFDAALRQELRRVRADVAEPLDRGRRPCQLQT
jgi:hypothetical protein